MKCEACLQTPLTTGSRIDAENGDFRGMLAEFAYEILNAAVLEDAVFLGTFFLFGVRKFFSDSSVGVGSVVLLLAIAGCASRLSKLMPPFLTELAIHKEDGNADSGWDTDTGGSSSESESEGAERFFRSYWQAKEVLNGAAYALRTWTNKLVYM